MTELSMLYGNYDSGDMLNDTPSNQEKKPNVANSSNGSVSAGQQIHQLASQPIQQIQSQQVLQAPIPPQATIQNTQHIHEHMSPYNQQVQQQVYKRKAGEYSFWGRMSIKRPEVMKLAMFSLVIVLAIAIDRMGTHYISKYINENVLSDMQEFLLRLTYPLVIFLVLWMAKSA